MSDLALLKIDAAVTAARMALEPDAVTRRILLGELEYLTDAIGFEEQLAECLSGRSAALVLPQSVVQRGAVL